MSFEVKRKVFAGIVLSLFLVTVVFIAIPVQVSAQFVGTVKIGVVGPKGWIQWHGLWEGAQMARDIINDAWGLKGPAGNFEVVLVDIDEHAVGIPDPSAAIAELLSKLDANPDMQFLIGGFRTECVQPMREAAMDYAAVNGRPIWFITGAARDELIDCGETAQCDWGCVRHNYDRYKYMFRVNPCNATTLFKQLLFGPLAQIVAPKLAALYGSPVKTYIIAEDSRWCDVMVENIEFYGPLLTTLHSVEPSVPQFYTNLQIVGKARPSPIETDFSSFLDDVAAKGAKLVIHIFSAVAGTYFIQQWGAEQRPFVCFGINDVESQMQEFWEEIDGLCEYETILATVGTRTNLNPNAKPLSTVEVWDEYLRRFGHCPIYTMWGTYDYIISMNETFYDASLPGPRKGWYDYWTAGDTDGLIRFMESQGAIDGFHGGVPAYEGVLGRFMFTGVGADPTWPLCGIYHDVYCASDCLAPVWPSYTVRPFVVQWQPSRLSKARMEVVWPQDQVFSRKYMFPPWMFAGWKTRPSLSETDFAGGTPIPTAIPGYNYPAPDHKVDMVDLSAVIYFLFKTPPFFALDADMANPYVASGEPAMDHFIDVFDVAKVANDYGKSY